jgi:hypothetical protein
MCPPAIRTSLIAARTLVRVNCQDPSLNITGPWRSRRDGDRYELRYSAASPCNRAAQWRRAESAFRPRDHSRSSSSRSECSLVGGVRRPAGRPARSAPPAGHEPNDRVEARRHVSSARRAPGAWVRRDRRTAIAWRSDARHRAQLHRSARVRRKRLAISASARTPWHEHCHARSRYCARGHRNRVLSRSTRCMHRLALGERLAGGCAPGWDHRDPRRSRDAGSRRLAYSRVHRGGPRDGTPPSVRAKGATLRRPVPARRLAPGARRVAAHPHGDDVGCARAVARGARPRDGAA